MELKTIEEYIQETKPIILKCLNMEISKKNYFVSSRHFNKTVMPQQFSYWGDIPYNLQRTIVKRVFMRLGLLKWSDAKNQVYLLPHTPIQPE